LSYISERQKKIYKYNDLILNDHTVCLHTCKSWIQRCLQKTFQSNYVCIHSLSQQAFLVNSQVPDTILGITIQQNHGSTGLDSQYLGYKAKLGYIHGETLSWKTKKRLNKTRSHGSVGDRWYTFHKHKNRQIIFQEVVSTLKKKTGHGKKIERRKMLF
jgi:hypothetical protein